MKRLIITGFEPEIVLSSVKTVIEEYKNRTLITQIEQIKTDKNNECHTEALEVCLDKN